MNDPIIKLLVILIVVAAFALWVAVQHEITKHHRTMREAQKREAEAEYHKRLAGKYAATMTEEDRKWYASLPDWDRLPIFRTKS